MNKTLQAIILTLCCLSAAGAEFPADWPAERDGAVIEQPIVYGTGGGRDLRLALVRPASGNGPWPGVVFVHGGGWRGGDAKHFLNQAVILAGHGYVSACIEYRLTPEAPFPAQIEDVKCAIRWMRAHAGKYHIDPGRIAVAGGSAGGHLALLASTSDGVRELEGCGGWQDQSSRVQLAAGFNPAVKLEGKTGGSVRMLMGDPYHEIPDRYRLAEPETHLDPGDPPVIIMHGTADRTVPYQEAVFYISLVRSMGIDAALYTDEGHGHAWFNHEPYLQQTLEAFRGFMDSHFK